METLAHPDDLSSMRKEQNAAILNRRPYKLLYRVCLDSDRRKWIWDQGECLYDEDGKPTYLEGIMIDISTRSCVNTNFCRKTRIYAGPWKIASGSVPLSEKQWDA